MRSNAILIAFIVVVAALIGWAVAYTGGTPRGALGKPRVKLAVLVVFDQLRADYLEKWQPIFVKDGFVRLQSEGAWFTNCHYPYATTTTGPGHASMLTGTCPDRHGIINNNWFERGSKSGSVYCAGSEHYKLVPYSPPPPPKDGKAPDGVGTPERLQAETVADVLKAVYPRSKVFGLSLKDRSAILPTGKQPTGAFWFNSQFVTSTYYTDHLPGWVEKFNNSGIAQQWFGVPWTRLRTDVNYEKWSDLDIVPGEGKGVEVKDKKDPAFGWCQGVAFPHPNTGGRDKPGVEYYLSLANSPFGNDLLFEFTRQCVVSEELGQRDVPDLLVVSFSSNDLIGHTWGPDSQEVLDVTLRSDEMMAKLITFLNGKVGWGQYILAVTADHGVCPLVEVSQSRGIDARRVDPVDLQTKLEAHLAAKFGAVAGAGEAKTAEGKKKSGWVEEFVFPWIYFNKAAAKAAGKDVAEVAKAASEFLKANPDVERALTLAEIDAGFPANDAIGNRIHRSSYPGRSGDVYVLLKEWYLPSKVHETGTTHGTPYEYDTHVPLLVYGPGITGGVRKEAITPQATAAIFARWLGLRLPNKAEFPVPEMIDKP
jgi:hypothetical protein